MSCVVAFAFASAGGMVSAISGVSRDFRCSISISEQLSELESAESIEVMVMSTALSLPLGLAASRGFSAAGFESELGSSSRGCATKLLLLMSSMALRNCQVNILDQLMDGKYFREQLPP